MTVGGASDWSDTYLFRLEDQHGFRLSTIREAWALSRSTIEKIRQAVATLIPAELSLVTFGSLARMEFTSGSDIDWCLLVDGRADSGHRAVGREVSRVFSGLFGDKAPNPTGAFGSLVFSHELIHCIGGAHDTNANLTRRLLLVVESLELNKPEVNRPHSRISRAILQRYFEEETRFPDKSFFPRFFLNDVVRFWRTMAVDFAAKTHERGPKSWALRNVKLRFSRKLLFVAGLLLAFETSLYPESDLMPHGYQAPLPFDDACPEFSSAQRCLWAANLSPLEILARACLSLGVESGAIRAVFEGYDTFLKLLSDEGSRRELSRMDFGEAGESSLFREAREIGHEFQRGLDEVFFNTEEIKKLTLKYGLF